MMYYDPSHDSFLGLFMLGALLIIIAVAWVAWINL